MIPAPAQHPIDQLVESLAAAQCGRVSRRQIRKAGVASWYVGNRLRSGRLRRVTSAVLSLPGAPNGEVPDLWTASLHIGDSSTVSHTSAFRHHGVPGVPDRGPRLIVLNGGNRHLDWVTVHQTRRLPDHHVVEIGGLVVTSVARTLVDLAAESSVSRLEGWLDHLTAEKRLHPREVAEVIDEVHQGRRGLSGLMRVVGQRLPGRAVEQGRLERLLTGVLRTAGTGPGVAQHPHPGSAVASGLVDRAFPAARLVIEVDGRRWHDRRLANLTDIRRDRDAAAAGWLTIRYVYDEMARAGEARGFEIRSIHDRRLVDLGVVGLKPR